MSIEFCIGCTQCREYIDLNSWAIISEVRQVLTGKKSINKKYAQKLDENVGKCIVKVNEKDLIECVNKEESIPHNRKHILDLIPIIKNFIQSHHGHELFLISDIWGLPWDFDNLYWYEWKEIGNPHFYHGDFLPPNLIEDYKISSWDAVLDLYKIRNKWILNEQSKCDLDKIRKAFENST
jgi:hypothetical protein